MTELNTFGVNVAESYESRRTVSERIWHVAIRLTKAIGS